MNGDDIDVSVDGNAIDLANLFANVLNENEDLMSIILMAISAVQEKAMEGEASDEDIINALKAMGKVGEA